MYINTTTSNYPVTESDIKLLSPNTSFTFPFVPPAPYAWVFPQPVPVFDALTQQAVEGPPVKTGGTWKQVWNIVDLPQEQAEINQQNKIASIQTEIVFNTQKRLDAFAKTRNYDGILSACTYATSTIPKFQTEGQHCVNLRDATWTKLYQILDEVQAQTRPMPSGYADVEGELPTLVWPN